jgi:hypothetical protein
LTFELKGLRCQQAISPHDTVESDGYRVAHVDCSSPRSLGPEAKVSLYAYCWDHAVAECVACAQSFRQQELISEPFIVGTVFCLHCRRDLTESVRAHLVSCSRIPEQLRQKVRETCEVTQKLLKRSHELLDHTDVLVREIEAIRAELNATRRRWRRKTE